MNVIKRIHDLAKEQSESLHNQLTELGAETSDEHGRLIPQPKNKQERTAFLAGQLSANLFFMGASIYHDSTQLFVFERQGNPSQKFAIPALNEEEALEVFQKYLDDHTLEGRNGACRDYWRLKIAGKVDGSVFSLSNI